MSILTKEGIQKILNDDWLLMDDCEGLENCTVIKELARMALAAMDSEPVAWGNGCDKTVPAALRYLAENERPFGGESRFNAAHLYQLAREIEFQPTTAPAKLARGNSGTTATCAPWCCSGNNLVTTPKTICHLMV